MRLHQVIRPGRWLLPILVVGMISSASSQQFADPEDFASGDIPKIRSSDRADPRAQDKPPPVEDDEEYRTYTVVEGDTLWDISSRMLGSPWYWPQVWSYNPQIANPHWIYPGNMIRLMSPTGVGPAQILEDADGLLATDSRPSEEIVTSAGELTFRIPESVGVVDRGFITREEIESVGQIVASFEEKMLMTRFDRVYANIPNAAVGERYVVFRTGREVKHPHTNEHLGFQTELVGELTIAEVHSGGVATGVIGDILDAVQRGDRLIPWSDTFTRTVVKRENTIELQGMIIASLVPRTRVFAQNQYVFLDIGEQDGLIIGNTLDVVRQGDPLAAYLPNPREDLELPWETVGEVLVIETRSDTSVGLIIRSIRELEPGEKVMMRVKGGLAQARR